MQIRGLEVADQAIIRIKAETIAAEYYPELIPAIDAEHAMLTEFRTDTRQYAKVVGGVGEPKAALLAKVSGNLWATKKHATVLLWYSEIPGAGIALLRDFRRWVRADFNKSIVLAGFMDDFGLDERTRKLVTRVGFGQRGGAYVHFPGGSKRL